MYVHASFGLIFSATSTANQMTKDFKPDLSEKQYSFDDVQGIDEAKAEVTEIVEFLKNPEKFQRLGAKLPTGELQCTMHMQRKVVEIYHTL